MNLHEYDQSVDLININLQKQKHLVEGMKDLTSQYIKFFKEDFSKPFLELIGLTYEIELNNNSIIIKSKSTLNKIILSIIFKQATKTGSYTDIILESPSSSRQSKEELEEIIMLNNVTQYVLENKSLLLDLLNKTFTKHYTKHKKLLESHYSLINEISPIGENLKTQSALKFYQVSKERGIDFLKYFKSQTHFIHDSLPFTENVTHLFTKQLKENEHELTLTIRHGESFHDIT